jgi:hypothetical protein
MVYHPCILLNLSYMFELALLVPLISPFPQVDCSVSLVAS